MIRYLLDTDTCIYVMNHRPERVLERMRAFKTSELAISVITLFELTNGALKSQKVSQNLDLLERLTQQLQPIPFEADHAKEAARIRRHLENAGQPIGGYDLLIAAHTLALDVTLVSNNAREFARVPDLKLENWAE